VNPLASMEVEGGPQYTGRPAEMIGFVDAVNKALIHNYVNFDGRASRSEYWWWMLAMFAISIPVSFLDGMIFGWGLEDPTWFGNILTVAVFLPGLGLSFRRLHDTGRSGWWLLMNLIPCVGLIVIIVFLATDGQPHPNDYGEVPTNTL